LVFERDKQREKLRVQKLKQFKETGKWPMSKKKLKELDRYCEGRRRREERKEEAKKERKQRRKDMKQGVKRQRLTRKDVDELEDDVRLIKKWRRGKVGSLF
jgi:ATP-dependent RNA helicase DDX55/SPB4